MSRRVRLGGCLKNLALVCVSMLAFALVAEAVLAVVKINTKSILRFVPDKGLTYVPGAYYRSGKEGFSEGRINRHGFRDRQRSWDKPPGTYRVVVLGDSYTEAFQVSLEQAFPAIVEDRLNERAPAGIRYEVLNLGHSGFGTADAYMRYLHFGRRYDPDLVLLAFYLGNDFRNNSRILNRDHPGYYFRPDGEGGLELDDSSIREYTRRLGPIRRAFQWVKRRSYLASLLSERWFLLRRQALDEQVAARHTPPAKREAGPRTFFPLADGNVYLEDPPDLWREAFEVTRRALDLFRDTVRADGAEFVVVSIAAAESIHPRLHPFFEDRVDVDLDFSRPDRILAEWAAGADVPYLGLIGPLGEYHAATGEYLHGFDGWPGGHWNERGHAVAAEAIVTFLREAGFVGSSGGSQVDDLVVDPADDRARDRADDEEVDGADQAAHERDPVTDQKLPE